MLHPLLHLIATQPHLLAEHAQVYAELAAAEAGEFSTRWKRRALLLTMAAFFIGLAVVLAGIALMLWAAMPVAQMQAPWALLAVPLALAAVAGLCWLAGRPQIDAVAFSHLRRQVKADMLMLREVAAP